MKINWFLNLWIDFNGIFIMIIIIIVTGCGWIIYVCFIPGNKIYRVSRFLDYTDCIFYIIRFRSLWRRRVSMRGFVKLHHARIPHLLYQNITGILEKPGGITLYTYVPLSFFNCYKCRTVWNTCWNTTLAHIFKYNQYNLLSTHTYIHCNVHLPLLEATCRRTTKHITYLLIFIFFVLA